MHAVAILNAESGTLRSNDVEDFCRRIEAMFADAGHRLETRAVGGKDIVRALEEAFGESGSEAVIVAGGDGTVSCAGSLAWKNGKPMGVIPAGTLNLFARSLGVPMEIFAAAQALANSKVVSGDIATANDRAFLHHYSVGFQPRIVQLREERGFSSRLGKIQASIAAAFASLRKPPSFPVELAIDGKDSRSMRLSTLSISNNLFGEGHIPYADDLSAGVLGIYHARPASQAAQARMLADMTLGTWRANPDITEETANRVSVAFPRIRRKAKAVVDGELVDLPEEIEFRIHPGELKLLRPQEEE